MNRPGQMTILLISGSRIVGGAERAGLQLARGLIERGQRVEALCPAGGEWQAALSTAGVRVHSAPVGGSLNLIAPLIIARAVSATRPDLLIVTTSDAWVWSCLIPRRTSAPRLVLVRHMALPLPYRVRRMAGRRADAIVAVSRSVRESLLTDSAIPPGLVRVIPNATRFAPRASVPGREERIYARATLGLTPSGRWIGFLGGINRGKGIEDVMAAARYAGEALGDVSLLVCGRKDPRRATPDCGTLARHHGVEGKVHYLGQLEDVRPALIAADAVAIATRATLREGLSQTAIDTMACGTPIAAYALGGVIDVVGETDPAAVLARPDDVEDLGRAVTRLLTDQGLAARIASDGLKRAREAFDPDRMVDSYERLFADLLSR
jgi:glycosyltransferase involved in cell wall biosynthesis